MVTLQSDAHRRQERARLGELPPLRLVDAQSSRDGTGREVPSTQKDVKAVLLFGFLLLIVVGIVDFLRRIFRKFHEFSDAGWATEEVFLSADDPETTRVRPRVRHGANQVARLRVEVVR